MRIVVSGSSGLVGSALVPALRSAGHDVVRLVRREATAPDEVRWDARTFIDTNALGVVDAAVHLAGAGVGDHRWTMAYKQELRDSRVLSTSLLARTLAAMDPRPQVFVSGSAIGYYGDTGDAWVDESGVRGNTFLARLVEEWESASGLARDAGIRTVNVRSGLIVSAQGGAWGKLVPLFKLGVGGPLAGGQQYWSFISVRDEVEGIMFCLTNEHVSGPINLTAPEPATNGEITKVMGSQLHRPAFLPVPSFALRTVVGEFADEILMSQRVSSQAITDLGFRFADPDFASAFESALGQDQHE